jgi:hypothetical protein
MIPVRRGQKSERNGPAMFDIHWGGIPHGEQRPQIGNRGRREKTSPEWIGSLTIHVIIF